MLCFHAAQTGKHLLWTQNVSEQNQKHFFVSATNVVRPGKRGNICVGNNVSSFARALRIDEVPKQKSS